MFRERSFIVLYRASCCRDSSKNYPLKCTRDFYLAYTDPNAKYLYPTSPLHGMGALLSYTCDCHLHYNCYTHLSFSISDYL